MSLTKQLFSRMWMHVQNKFDEMVGNKPVSEQIAESLNIDYDELAFDTSEIVFGNLVSTSSVLGQAILGQLVLA